MATTPIFGIAYRGDGELGWPLNQITEEMANSVEAALSARGLSVAPMSSALGSNGARTVTGTTFTPDNSAGDHASITIARPPSNRLNVRVFVQAGVSAAQGIVGFEVRDTNSSGTVRNAAGDADAIILPGTVSGNNTYMLEFDITTSGSSTNVFVRPMFRVTSAGPVENPTTLTLQRVRIYVRHNP